ncbi:hypothetical protein V8G54_012234 [Vigna mungo]|uniref:Sucrase n=1 Tax=Vigna mungo TaxID=3915 RepID=A0AAQ3NSJ1_VIGMU
MASSAAVDEAKHGFSRSEMYKENLAGTVDAYDRHVFLCYKNHSVWPPRIEASEADPLPKRVASVWKARKNDVVVKESNVDGFFDDVIVSGKEWSSGGEKSVLRGSHIFVCAHGSRDVRCGVCGPVLLDKLNEETQLRGLKDQISVVACSHVGGHKYGYVTPDDVPALLDRQIAKGEVIQKLWRLVLFVLFSIFYEIGNLNKLHFAFKDKSIK